MQLILADCKVDGAGDLSGWPEMCATNSPVELPNRYNLTRRELQMVQALSGGMTNKDIAAHFSISEFTVKYHLGKIFDKVGVYSRLELLVFAKHHGLVGANPAA